MFGSSEELSSYKPDIEVPFRSPIPYEIGEEVYVVNTASMYDNVKVRITQPPLSGEDQLSMIEGVYSVETIAEPPLLLRISDMFLSRIH